MSATAEQRAAGLKLKGNECFQKGKLNAAIDMYTEAIVLDPTQSTFFSNRALCHSKLQHWAECRDDCEQALRCDALNTKASYLLGLSLAHLEAFESAIEAFKRALSSAEKGKKSPALVDEIALELRRTRKRQWEHTQARRLARHERMKRELARLFEASMRLRDQPADGDLDGLMAYMEQVSERHEQDMFPGTIPEYFMCPVSMEIMFDPVSTPNGVSYERRYVEEHLRKNGPVDPLTRQRLTHDMLRPNTSLRLAIEDFLDKHPWAFEH